MNKWKLRTSDIERILPMVSRDESEMFNRDYIENLYRQYMSVKVNDTKAFETVRSGIKGKEILLIAPGSSIKKKQWCNY